MANAVKNVLRNTNRLYSAWVAHPGASIALLCMLVGVTACEKYTDPKGPDLSEELTNPYCNDPRAVNYNHGFPGKPDSSVCIYPVDSFVGNWLWDDSVFTTDLTFVRTEQHQINITATEDTLLSHLKLSGWCNRSFYLTADKYRRALTDTLIEGSIGQLGCLDTDTLSGFLNKNTGAAETLLFQLAVTDATGTLLHYGTATKVP